MIDPDIHKLVSLIEDLICHSVELNEFEDIMPKISKLMFNRYCSVTGDHISDLKNKTMEIKPKKELHEFQTKTWTEPLSKECLLYDIEDIAKFFAAMHNLVIETQKERSTMTLLIKELSGKFTDKLIEDLYMKLPPGIPVRIVRVFPVQYSN